MQIAPETEMMHELTPEELKALQACFLEIIKDIDRVSGRSADRSRQRQRL